MSFYNGSGAFRAYLQLDPSQNYAFWTGGGNDFAFSSDDAGNMPSGAYIYLKNSNGNIGVGTKNPLELLQLQSAGNPAILFWGSGSQTGGLRLVGGVGRLSLFDDGSNERLTLLTAGGAMQGNVGIGTTNPAAKLHVAGNAQVDGNIAAKYQDVAEWVTATGNPSQGTVVIIDPRESNRVTAASEAYDTRVAGIVSMKPGVLLGEEGPDKAKVAHSGRVKVKADATYGPIAVGDLLVTSRTPGYVMRSEPLDLGGAKIHRPGTLVGKALEPLDKGQGEILVLLTLE
jgi:hypothetical protein